MAKIAVSIDGDSLELKVDGKKVENLNSMDLSFYKGCCGIYFAYSVSDEEKDGEFKSTTRYVYDSSKASFAEGIKIDGPYTPRKNNPYINL